MGRVEFGGFVILWFKPNPTRYKNFFCNLTQSTKPWKPTQPGGSSWVGSGRVWQVGGFSAHPYTCSLWRGKTKSSILFSNILRLMRRLLWVFSYIFNLKLVYWDWCQCTVASCVDNYTCMWDHSFTFIFFWVEIEF